MAKKGPMRTFKTIDDYIAIQPPMVQSKLQELRTIIKAAAPDAIEMINYKIPCFSLVEGGKRDQQVMMAGYEKFIGFYPFPNTVAAFSEELSEYTCGKGSVQFPLDRPLPSALIAQMVQFRRKEVLRNWETKGNGHIRDVMRK